MSADWGTAVVVEPGVLRALRHENARLRARTLWAQRGLCVLAAAAVVCGVGLRWTAGRAGEFAHGLRECRRSAQRSSRVLDALARSHEDILTAAEQAPAVGTKSWGRRFSVTMYTPRSPKYGKFNDGLTATLTKADPTNRIVAVDPQLIPYGSWVWIEDLGWFHAEDCGADIKGFRLDLLGWTEDEARKFGRRERFAIVVPADA